MKLFPSVLAVFFVLAVPACKGDADNQPTDSTIEAERAQTSPDNTSIATVDTRCEYYRPGEKNLYWGDLHVHTAVSLDAYAFGTLRGPTDAFNFAKGEKIELFGREAQLERPLDFTAVTDHAEWMDLMYICTDPEKSDHLYCQNLTQQKASADIGLQIFREYVGTTIGQAEPQATPVCTEDPERCAVAQANQWARTQKAANDANDPCNFTALIGYEWSATPNFSHTHRNIIFRSDKVTEEAIDYIRFPKLHQLWEQLERQCRPEDGCDVVAIPHNTNMGDGVSFDVETETDAQLLMRAKYERLVEIHQDKGNSECLPAYGETGDGDCDFEVYLTEQARLKPREHFTEESWDRTRSSYVRSLLLRGLEAYQAQSDMGNPLQLGIVASTDNHVATPGFTDEESWLGSVFGAGDLDLMMSRIDFNPGGIVGVWSEENTRASIFDALKRRETYGTSGPRIQLRFDAVTDGRDVDCDTIQDREGHSIPMGGEFSGDEAAPRFVVRVKADREPLAQIEIIKGEYAGGELNESVQSVWSAEDNDRSACVAWTDPDYDPAAPAFWYARVKQAPTKRWSQVRCELAGRCDDFPRAERMIQERAWSSPIWNLPLGPEK